MDLDWSILDKAKPYSPASKKCMSCLTEKYLIIFSTKNLLNKRNEPVTKCRHENKFYLANYKDIHHNYLSKTFFLKRLENIFEVNSITLLKVFHNRAYRLRITI